MTALVLAWMLSGPTASAVGPIVSIEIAPTTVSLTTGSSASFTVIGQDKDGATQDLTAYSTFTTTDSLGRMNANSYQAGSLGSWKVTATHGTLTSEASVTVNPTAVVDVVVNPNSTPERIASGQNRTFSAAAYDGANNPIASASFTWTVEGEIGTVKPSGASAIFTASKAGTGRIVATSGGAKGFVDITVSAAAITTNTNSSNTNTANTNVPAANTNAATNANVAPDNNTNASPATNEQTDDSTCQAWPRSAWVWLFLGYVILLAASLWSVRRSKPSWWWAAPFILTVAVLWMYFQFRCYPVYPGFPYLVLLSAIIGASWFTWSRGSGSSSSTIGS